MKKTIKNQIENAVRDAATGIERNWTVRLFADGSVATTHDNNVVEPDEHIVLGQSEKMDWQDFIEDCMAEQVEARQKKCPTETHEQAVEEVMPLFIEEDYREKFGELCVSLINWGKIEVFCDEHRIHSLQDRDDKNWQVRCSGEMWTMQQGQKPQVIKVTPRKVE